MGKKKKTDITAEIESFISNLPTQTHSFVIGEGEDSMTIESKNYIPIGERIIMIEEMADICFSNEGKFVPSLTNYAYYAMLLKYYTSLPIDKMDVDSINRLIFDAEVGYRLENAIPYGGKHREEFEKLIECRTGDKGENYNDFMDVATHISQMDEKDIVNAVLDYQEKRQNGSV